MGELATKLFLPDFDQYKLDLLSISKWVRCWSCPHLFSLHQNHSLTLLIDLFLVWSSISTVWVRGFVDLITTNGALCEFGICWALNCFLFKLTLGSLKFALTQVLIASLLIRFFWSSLSYGISVISLKISLSFEIRTFIIDFNKRFAPFLFMQGFRRVRVTLKYEYSFCWFLEIHH